MRGMSSSAATAGSAIRAAKASVNKERVGTAGDRVVHRSSSDCLGWRWVNDRTSGIPLCSAPTTDKAGTRLPTSRERDMSSNHGPGDVRLASVVTIAALLLFLAFAAASGQTGPLIEPVTDAELAATPDGDWLSFRGNLSAWGYSALDAIDTETVGQLDFAWAAPMEDGPNEATPLVARGHRLPAADGRRDPCPRRTVRRPDLGVPAGARLPGPGRRGPCAPLRPGSGPDHAQHRDLAGRPVRRHDGRLHHPPGRKHRRAGVGNTGRRQPYRPLVRPDHRRRQGDQRPLLQHVRRRRLLPDGPRRRGWPGDVALPHDPAARRTRRRNLGRPAARAPVPRRRLARRLVRP